MERLALVASLFSLVNGQQSGWQKNQVNATMCTWSAPRAAVVRDTVYIDGGYLYWTPGMSDGSYGILVRDDNPLGLVYSLNFSRPFNMTANFTELFGTISKAPNGNAANNLAPNYYDGAMFSNDNQFFLYGGLLTLTDSYSPPDGNNVLGYKISQYGPERQWYPGWVQQNLPGDLTRYITYGGAASSHSENKAWYFSGMQTASGGPIYYPGSNETLNPTNISNTLITLDMTSQQDGKWSNKTLPTDIKGRANPSVVWVPVGKEGILVSLGGVTHPDYANEFPRSDNEAQSRIDSPKFMANVDIYDIAGDKWYSQPTIAGPKQLALGCAVVAVADDYSSFNIYYYGGYDGLDSAVDYNDDVWILSLPSFMWMKVASGKAKHARAGHQCVTPYPDQMMVIGGYASLDSLGTPNCVDGGIVQLFNLTSGKWLETYDPSQWNHYGVPEMVHLVIGGGYEGGATMSTPTPTGWANSDLAKVFQTAYPTSKLTTYYPYESDAGNSTNRPNLSTGGGTPSWVAPVLGVVLSLVFITALVVGVLLYRRRKLLKKGGTSEGATDENGNRILSWIRGQDSQKAPTVSTEDAPNISDDMESRVGGHVHPYPQHTQPPMTFVQHHEMPDTPLVELMDTSPRAELGDTGLTPVDIINKHSHFAARSPNGGASTPTNPSSFSQNYTVSQDHGSISSQSQNRGITPRPDSPALGANGPSSAPAPAASPQPQQQQAFNNTRIVSGISGISEGDRAHLRTNSDMSVSSATATAATVPDTPTVAPVSPAGVNTMSQPLMSPPLPVTPPTAEGREAADYMSARGRSTAPGSSGMGTPGSTSSPLRRSVFYENKDDMGDRRQ